MFCLSAGGLGWFSPDIFYTATSQWKFGFLKIQADSVKLIIKAFRVFRAHVLRTPMCNLCRTRKWLPQSGSWTAGCGSSSDLCQTAPCQWSFCPDTPGEDFIRVWQNLRLPSWIFVNLLCSFPALMDTVLVCALWRSRMDNSGKKLVGENPDQQGLISCVTWSEINEDIKINEWLSLSQTVYTLLSNVYKCKFKSNTAFVI